ncbi:MAG: hypothetical protein AB7G80_06165 [Dongiaceae bacterium]
MSLTIIRSSASTNHVLAIQDGMAFLFDRTHKSKIPVLIGPLDQNQWGVSVAAAIEDTEKADPLKKILWELFPHSIHLIKDIKPGKLPGIEEEERFYWQANYNANLLMVINELFRVGLIPERTAAEFTGLVQQALKSQLEPRPINMPTMDVVAQVRQAIERS